MAQKRCANDRHPTSNMKFQIKSLLPFLVVAGIVVAILVMTRLRLAGGTPTTAMQRQADALAVVPPDALYVPSAKNPGERSFNLSPSIAARIDALVVERAAAVSSLAERNRQIRQELANRYLREKPDAVWAADKELALKEVGERSNLAASSQAGQLSTDCKRSVCKTTASFDSRSAAEEWIAIYTASMGNVTRRSLVSIRNEAQGVVVEIYSSGS